MIALRVYAGLALAYLLAPIAVIVAFSFNDTRSRFNFVWQGFTLEHWSSPFAVPGLGEALQTSVLIALLSFFLSFSVVTGFMTILIAHVMFCLSFVVVTVRSRLIGFDRSLEEAAQDLGASGAQTFLRITLPLIAPGIVAGALLAFALSIDDFVITNFNAGSTVTFPLFVYGAARVSIPPQVNVLATMIFLATLALMLTTVWQQRRAERMAEVAPEEV